jgi:hypothetical protein
MIIYPYRKETRFLLRARVLYPNASTDLSWRLGDNLESRHRSHMPLADILWEKRYRRYRIRKRKWLPVEYLEPDPPGV